MGFDTRDSLVKELGYAKEARDFEYAQQVRESIVVWDLDADYTLQFDIKSRKPYSGIESDGACYRFAAWCVSQGYEDNIWEAYSNLSGERSNRDGGSRWDLMDHYPLGDNGESIGAIIICGGCVYAEVWYDDKATAYIEIN